MPLYLPYGSGVVPVILPEPFCYLWGLLPASFPISAIYPFHSQAGRLP